MSADFHKNPNLVNNPSEGAKKILLAPTVRHILVFFNGAFPPGDAGKEKSPPQNLVKIQQDVAGRSDWFSHQLNIHYRIGHWSHPDEPIKAAVDFVKRNFDPRGMLYVLGNSAGGVDAVKFCKALSTLSYNFPVTSGLEAFDAGVSASGSTGSNVTALRVDGLWLHDAGFEVMQGERDKQRAVPGCVLGHLNYYMNDYNPPNNNAQASKEAEFHGKTLWAPTGQQANEGDGHNKLVAAPAVPADPDRKIMNSEGWSKEKFECQGVAHTKMIEDQEPETLKTIAKGVGIRWEHQQILQNLASLRSRSTFGDWDSEGAKSWLKPVRPN